MRHAPVQLIPTPRSLTITGGPLRLSAGDGRGHSITERLTGETAIPGSIHAQSYRMRISDGGDGAASVLIEAPAGEGLRHARTTLSQVVAGGGGAVPAMVIEDAPAIATRGVMLDVSRCRIPTMAEFARILDQLAMLKCNHVQLYTEHTFAYMGHEDAWRGWSPITPGEVRSLDAACRERGIELAANQNCFGHLAHWLAQPKYAPLAETHGDWLFDVWPRRGPFSLCPTDPASLAFVEDLLGQLLPNFTSRLVNIGCDETYDIAYGRSKGAVSRRGRGTVYAEFVSKVAAIASGHGKRPMFWADIALSQPRTLQLLPRDMIALAWNYEPGAPWEAWCDALGEAGMETWLCPGTSSWRSITGRTSERRANVGETVRGAIRHRTAGLLTCDWGDTGHWQVWPVALHGIANGLAAAWQGGSAIDLAAESLHLFGDHAATIAPWLDAFGDLDLALRQVCGALSRADRTRLPNQTAIFIDLFKGWDEQRGVGGPEQWERTMLLAGEMTRSPPHATDTLVRDELNHAATMALFAATRGWLRRARPDDAAMIRGIADDLARCRAEHRRLWALRSREGGLEQSCRFFDQIALPGGPPPMP